jgi:AcrR family transcriptional regulator
MSAPLTAPPQSLPANFQRAIDAAGRLIAERGIKGTSLREIGLAANVNFGNLTSYFGGKDRIVAECFRQATEANLQRLQAFLGEAAGLSLPAEYGPSILWDICQTGGTRYRTETLVIAELVLSCDGNPLFRDILASWFCRRTRAFRDWGKSIGLAPEACDALNMVTLSETCFYLSCGRSLLYRLVASGSLTELFALCSNAMTADHSESLPELADKFFSDARPPATDAGKEAVGASTRAQIIDAAADIVAEYGMDGVTSRLVAQKADISLGLISYHFPSITNLALAGLNRLLERVIEQMDDPETRNPILERVFDERRRPVSLPRASLFAYRSMFQLALTAGRRPDQAMAGQILRRRMGIVVIRAMDFSAGCRRSRTLASSFALATASLFTIIPALPEGEMGIDLPGLLHFLTRDMLGFRPAQEHTPGA